MPFRDEAENPCGYLGYSKKYNKSKYDACYAIIQIRDKEMHLYKDDPKKATTTPEEIEVVNLKCANMVDECGNEQLPQKFIFYITVDGKDLFFKANNDKDRLFWINIIKGLLVVFTPERSNSSAVRPLIQLLDNASLHKNPDDFVIDNVIDNENDAHDIYRNTMQIDRTSIRKAGYCDKIGNTYKSWKTRYFILNYQGLSYFKGKDDEQFLKLIRFYEMQDCHPASDTYSSHTDKCNLFNVVTAKRTYLIQAHSASDVESWIQDINELRKECKTKLSKSKANDERVKKNSK